MIPKLSPLQRAFINGFQGGFPLSERPYRQVGDRLGVAEGVLIASIQDLLAQGILSRFGPLFDAERLGGRFTLAALSVPEAAFDRVAAQVNALPQVAHNYRRDHALNMWFVLAVPSETALQSTLNLIRAETGLPVYDFPKQREFHLGFWLEIGETGALRLRRLPPREREAPEPLDALDQSIVAATQSGLPLVPEPYAQLAAQLDCSLDTLLRRLEKMLRTGAIRRIGAVPNHYRLGLRGNGMSVWDVPDDRAIALGEQLGALDFVSHCYLRPRRLPHWPYNLFAMVHGIDRTAVAEKTARIAALLGSHCRQHQVLYSTAVLKKTGLRLQFEPAPP